MQPPAAGTSVSCTMQETQLKGFQTKLWPKINPGKRTIQLTSYLAKKFGRRKNVVVVPISLQVNKALTNAKKPEPRRLSCGTGHGVVGNFREISSDTSTLGNKYSIRANIDTSNESRKKNLITPDEKVYK